MQVPDDVLTHVYSMNVDGERVHEGVHMAMRCTKVHIFGKHQGGLVSVSI